MFLLYPLFLVSAVLVAVAALVADAATGLGLLERLTFRVPGDLALVLGFTLAAFALTSALLRRVERGRALRRPFWRRHLQYCSLLYLLAVLLAPDLACGVDHACVPADHGLGFVAAVCALVACVVQALALYSVRRGVRLPRGSVVSLRASTV